MPKPITRRRLKRVQHRCTIPVTCTYCSKEIPAGAKRIVRAIPGNMLFYNRMHPECFKQWRKTQG